MKFAMPKKGEIEAMDMGEEMGMEEGMDTAAEEMPNESPDLSQYDDQVLLDELKKRGFEVE